MSRVYFTDRDLGKQFPSILTAAGLAVERHQDLFPPDGSDEQWLEYCGTQRRIAITHDQRIRYKVNEREAVVRHRVAPTRPRRTCAILGACLELSEIADSRGGLHR